MQEISGTLRGVIEVENSCFYIADEILDDQVSSIPRTGGLLLPGVGAMAIGTVVRDGFVLVEVDAYSSEPPPHTSHAVTESVEQSSYTTYFGSQRLAAGTLGECFGELAAVLTPAGTRTVHVRAAREVFPPKTLTQVFINPYTTFSELAVGERYRLQIWSEPATSSDTGSRSTAGSSADYTGKDNADFDSFGLQPGSTLK
ncbi:hypothetical protein [Rhodococcoides kyotonense]|uniref:Uncharacterized protein n=1 Tax=Rhodococcoides kyotonense TaxID=398843 RepID=A0A239MC68_9NOCA|nr:hypothetical protein [Rhodococcus kyotonensis]SNT40181.1 hypothetical protein SAMN05421642_11746 [Rhodococcus kyotonensis]